MLISGPWGVTVHVLTVYILIDFNDRSIYNPVQMTVYSVKFLFSNHSATRHFITTRVPYL